MDRIILIVFALFLVFSSTQETSAQIYKYVDKDGVVHFTDTPTDPKYQAIGGAPQKSLSSTEDRVNDLINQLADKVSDCLARGDWSMAQFYQKQLNDLLNSTASPGRSNKRTKEFRNPEIQQTPSHNIPKIPESVTMNRDPMGGVRGFNSQGGMITGTPDGMGGYNVRSPDGNNTWMHKDGLGGYYGVDNQGNYKIMKPSGFGYQMK